MTQLSFGASKLEAAFWRFHLANPHVYVVLKRLAAEWRRRHPERKCGIQLLWERARWELAVETDGPAPVLNNNHTAYYARLLMQDNPEFAGLFALRRQRIQAGIGPDGAELPPSVQRI